MATIPTGALPHRAWPSDDGSRVDIGLENGDAVDVIDTATHKVIARTPAGEAPQALLYLSHVAAGADDHPNLVARVNHDAHNIALKAAARQGGVFVVVRALGVVEGIEVLLFKLKPETLYSEYLCSQPTAGAAFMTEAKGAANGTMTGPVRAPAKADAPAVAERIVVLQGSDPANIGRAVLVSAL